MPEENDCPSCNDLTGTPVPEQEDVYAFAMPVPRDDELTPWHEMGTMLQPAAGKDARIELLAGIPEPSELIPAAPGGLTHAALDQPEPATASYREGVIHDATRSKEVEYLPRLGAPWFEPESGLLQQDNGEDEEEPPSPEDPCEFVRAAIRQGDPSSTVRINLIENRNKDSSWDFDRSLTGAEIADEFGGEDAWGHAQVSITHRVDVQFWYDRGCCCVWLQSIEINVAIRLYIASDTPKDEVARTEWHEAEHARMSRMLLGSLQALADPIAGQFGRHAPTCSMQPTQQDCERIRRLLEAQWEARVVRALTEYRRLSGEAADWFHDNEDELWRREQPAD